MQSGNAVIQPGGKLLQVAPSSGQYLNSCKWCHLVRGQYVNSCKWRHLVANFATHASGAIWWPFLQLMQVVAMLLPTLVQVTESISGSVVPLAMFFRWRAARQAAEMPVVAVILVEIYLKLIKITPETSEIFIILPK